MARLRVVSLDLDGTLVSRNYVDYFWLELVPQLYSERWGVPLEESKKLVFQAYEEIGPGDIRWYRPSYWFERFGFPDKLSWALSRAGELVFLYEDAARFLRRLSGKVELVISTSASREFIEVVFQRVPELSKYISRVFSSSSDFSLAGKPPEFFLRVMEKLGAKAEEVVHIGDDEVHDYENPRKVGIRAFLVTRSGNPNGFEGLAEIIEQLALSP
ncbi:MAG: HAD family hydrolase [Thermofilum sp.]|uniref:HAD family hydrolase n=1 Tax=Thermofilum pendens TaxID=2269 RepID=A0A7C4H912_THEPE